MELEGTFGDHYALQVIANLLERDIIIIPTKPESAHILKKYCIIKANKIENATPIYMLWYEETVYGVGHYQSIRPSCENVVVRHYNWSLNNQDSRFQTHASSAILAWSESTSKSIPSVSDTIVVEPQLCSSTLNTSAARTCHVCGLKYTKSMKKKLCTCKKFCHVKCYGKCIL